MVDERLALPRALRDAEYVKQHLLDQFHSRGLVEGCVKAQDWPGPFQSVSREVQLLHSVYCFRASANYLLEVERETIYTVLHM